MFTKIDNIANEVTDGEWEISHLHPYRQPLVYLRLRDSDFDVDTEEILSELSLDGEPTVKEALHKAIAIEYAQLFVDLQGVNDEWEFQSAYGRLIIGEIPGTNIASEIKSLLDEARNDLKAGKLAKNLYEQDLVEEIVQDFAETYTEVDSNVIALQGDDIDTHHAEADNGITLTAFFIGTVRELLNAESLPVEKE